VKLGYRASDGLMPEFHNLDPKVDISLKDTYEIETPRAIVGVSLGCHVEGVALPHPDTKDQESALVGASMRMGREPLVKNRITLRRYKKFVKRFDRKHFKPLSPDTDLSFEKWIATRPYPEWRKEELKAVFQDIKLMTIEERYIVVKCFIKDETYPAFKFARGIYARSDYFKCIFGPLVAAVEEEVYKHPAFIKKIPIKDRPQYIRDRLGNLDKLLFATDITSMEAAFDPGLMDACDITLMDYMCSRLDSAWWEKVYSVPKGENLCSFKHFLFKIVARRMSGEMSTSVFNGHANLTSIHFLCQENGLGEPVEVVEGDDGLFTTSSGKAPTPKDYAEIGLRVKLEQHESYATASFCGIIFDESDMINVTNPLEVLVEFGWANSRYVGSNKGKLLSLLRCKSLSYLHQYYGCPVIQEMALYGLRMSRSFQVKEFIEKSRVFSMWEREQLRQAVNDDSIDLINGRDVPMNTRLLVERQYGITVEMQLQLEEYFRGLSKLTPLVLDCLDFPTDWIRYGCHYVAPRNVPFVAQQRMNREILSYLGKRLKKRSRPSS